MPLSNDTRREFLRQMLTIRRAEEAIIHFATDHQGLIRGHYHVYIGQEASGVGTCAALGPKDYVFTTHRNHGHVIARGGELNPVLAEILGRTTGYNNGRGGTFHVIAPHLGILQTSGVVGGCMPLAAGAAFSAKTRKTDQVSLVFFGDGVLEEGAFYETINMASLWKLPVIFLCENNDVPRERRLGGACKSDSLAAKQLTDISERVFNSVRHRRRLRHRGRACRGDGCRRQGPARRRADLRGDAHHALARQPGHVPDADRGRFPARLGVLAGLGSEGAAGLATARAIRSRCSSARSIKDGAMTQRDVEAIDGEVRKAVESAARFAMESPAPKGEAALEHIFA